MPAPPQVATGKRPIVLVGDGAFQMTGLEAGNCASNGLSPIIIVFNNRSWETLRVINADMAANDLDKWDFAGLARCCNGVGVTARTNADLADALRRAHGHDGSFFLIDAQLSGRSAVLETYMSTLISSVAAANKRAAPTAAAGAPISAAGSLVAETSST